MRDQRCSYVQSLEVLRTAKQIRPDVVTKSSIMPSGFGEMLSEDELADLLAWLMSRRSRPVDLSPGSSQD